MKIGLLGFGTVGRGVDDILKRMNAGADVVSILVKDISETDDPRATTDFEQVLSSDVDTIVECMGGLEPAGSFVKQALSHGKHVVTSNKLMLANCFDDIMALAKEYDALFLAEASVGGGIPIMHNIINAKRIEKVFAFRGIINGTTNYILDKMATEGAEFYDVLKEAQRQGFAERDPSSDIDGEDVMYKSLILCNLMSGYSFELADIHPYGVRHLTKADMAFGKGRGRVLKLVGEANINKGYICVMPEFVHEPDGLSKVPSNYNRIEYRTDSLEKIAIEGQGAGRYPTANAVVSDILSILHGDDYSRLSRDTYKKKRMTESISSRFYIRDEDISRYEDIMSERVDDHALITKHMCIDDIKVGEKTFIARW